MNDLWTKHKATMITITLLLVLVLSGYLYLSNLDDIVAEAQSNALLNSNIKLSDDVDFTEVEKKHSFDETTDEAGKKLKESIIEKNRKLELKRQEKEKALLDSIANLKRQQDSLLLVASKKPKIKTVYKKKKKKETVQKVEEIVVVEDMTEGFDDFSGESFTGIDSESKPKSRFLNKNSQGNKSSLKESNSTGYIRLFLSQSKTDVRTGSMVFFKNEEELIIDGVTIPQNSKFETVISLSGNNCRFNLKRIITSKMSYDVNASTYDVNYNPYVFINTHSGSSKVANKAKNLGKSAISLLDPTGLSSVVVDDELTSNTNVYTNLDKGLVILAKIKLN